MKYRAVIFDLFGTLVSYFSEKEYRQILLQMALILSVPADEFWQLWSNSFDERALGIQNNLESQINNVCQKMGLTVDRSKIQAAANVRLKYTILTMKPRWEAVTVLSTLKSKGYKIGLITDCSFETASVWKNTPFAPFFDATVFSCLVGLKKPDPRIYQLALANLEIDAGFCLYVGDGNSLELTGAAKVGMYPVLIRDLEEKPGDTYRVDNEAATWKGPAITSLRMIYEFLE